MPSSNGHPITAPAADAVDTVQNVSAAMIVASAAIRHGASDARTQAENLAAQISHVTRRSIYTTCYCLSYGVVFPTVLVSSLLPLDNALGRGLADGARAAREQVDALRRRKPQPVVEHVPSESWGIVPAV